VGKGASSQLGPPYPECNLTNWLPRFYCGGGGGGVGVGWGGRGEEKKLWETPTLLPYVSSSVGQTNLAENFLKDIKRRIEKT